MGGVAKTVGRVVSGVFTLGGSEIARNNLGPKSAVTQALNLPGTVFTGGLNGGIPGMEGGGSYTPKMLSAEDPKLLLAQSGGAPLLTQIALGSSVDDALAGYFGRAKGDDWNAYLANLSPDEQAAIAGVRTQLQEIQSNTDLRNQAVQKLVKDYPNIVSRTAPAVVQAKQAAGEEFDAASKEAMNYALKATGAQFNLGGMLSSGAAAEASARVGAQYGMEKLGYQNDQGNQALNLLNNDWTNQYNEANALRNFQQTMLGAGVNQGFSANQAYLNRNQQTQMANVNSQNQADYMSAQNDQAMMGAIGGVVGTVAGAYVGGPMGAAAGGKIGSGFSGGGYAPQGVPINYNAYPSTQGWNPSGNPRLNLARSY